MTASLQMGTTRGRGALAATILGSGMTFLDSTIANIAVKRIGQQFHASFTQLQWVVNAYMLALASLILLGGSLGDRLGRRRIFLTGTAWFTLASLLCALAPNIEALITARALQGIGAALMMPGSLAIISASFAQQDRAKAVGAWSGLAGVATALGPLLGGWLVQDFSWRWAFAINTPLGIAVVVLALRFIPETYGGPETGPETGTETGTETRPATQRHPSAQPPRLDLAGTVLIAAALGALTFGTTQVGTSGWTTLPIVTCLVGAALLAAFVVVERHRNDPLVPVSLFASRTFTGTNAMTLLTYAALSVVFFVLVLHLQVAAGYGALAAGLATLPVTILLLLLSARSGALADRIGPRTQLIAGPLLSGGGLALTLRIDATHSNYLLYVLPGITVFGLGLACLVAPLTATVMASAPSERLGIASAINNAIARTGGLLAVAVLPPLAGLRGEAYRQVSVMVHGYRIVTLSCIGLLICAGLVTALTVPNRLPTERRVTETESTSPSPKGLA